MSGFEIVGIILGAFSLAIAGPLKSLGDSINSVASSSESFQDFLEAASSRAFLYETRYLELCRMLLKPVGLEDSELKAMFEPGGHEQEKWKDKVFIATLDQYLASDRAIIHLSMKNVQREVVNLQKRVQKLSKDIISYIFVPGLCKQNTSGSKLLAKDKYHLSKGKRGKIEKCLNDFRDRLDEFEKIVKDFVEKTTKDLTYQRRHARQVLDAQLWTRVSDRQWLKILQRITLAQSSSERLFKILYEKYQCGCHKLKLWLDFDLVATLTPRLETHNPLSYYRFLVTLTTQQYIDITGSVLMQVDSIQTSRHFEKYHTLEIASGPISSRRQLKSFSTRRSAIVSHFQPNQQSIQDEYLAQHPSITPPLPVLPVLRKPASEKSSIQKNIRFACDFKKKIHLKRRDSISEQPQSTCPPSLRTPEQELNTSSSEEASTEDQGSSDTSELHSVENLCELLSALGSLQRSQRSSLGCLKDSGGYRHQLFDGCNQTIEQEPSATLRDLLPQIDHFLPDDRLRTAYHLASSLLQLHLPTWVTEGWSSSELMLMHKDRQAGREDWLLFSECFKLKDNDIDNINQPNSAHIHQLGIILLEIGQAEPLSECCDPIQQTKNAPKRVKKVLGRPYWSVVDTCLNWNDRTGLSEDLSDESVQRRFYDEVVQKLKTWVELFGS